MRKFLVLFLIINLIILSTSTACSKSQEKTTTPPPSVVSPVPALTGSPSVKSSSPVSQTNWWDKFGQPKYGGTLTIRAGGDTSIDAGSFDPAKGFIAGPTPWFEPLFHYDWAVDRSIWAFQTGWVPYEYYAPLLGESWEQTDPITYVVKIRKGVHWHNKPPVNGRELVADDFQFGFERNMKENPMFAMMNENLASIKATDKYTLEIKLKKPSAFGPESVFSNTTGVARELVALIPSTSPAAPTEAPPAAGPPSGEAPPAGPPGPTLGGTLTLVDEFQNGIGTGPWMPGAFIRNSSMTVVRNPDYWGFDERHPANKLPYFDEVKYLQIPDLTTAIAAFRTGKIDLLTDMRGGLNWQQRKSILETNPDAGNKILYGPGSSVELRCDNKPFTDIRVRKALQMAIDRKTIAQSHLGGLVDGTPCGILSPLYTGWSTPYQNWPDELKEEYSYNPQKAKQLLADAGFPNGFTTNCVASSGDDITLLQVIKSYFHDIGVEMEINAMDQQTYQRFCEDGKNDQMALTNMTGGLMPPLMVMQGRYSKFTMRNYTHNNDPYYDEMFQKLNAAATIEEAQKLCNEMDMYAIKQHWAVNVCQVATPLVWQPYLKGYSGELMPTADMYARWWSAK